MIRVVSNASPLINLARIGQFQLLTTLFGTIRIPDAVYDEVVVRGAGQPGSDEVGNAVWIERQSVANLDLVRALRQELDAGEAESIALALERQADLLLMDERLGREVALQLGVRTMGLVGLLAAAKHRGLLPAVKGPLQALRHVAGFRLSEQLVARVLHDEGEE